MKGLNVISDSVQQIDIGLVVDRWRVQVFGAELVELYRYDLIIPNRDSDHMSLWTLHVWPFKQFGVGGNLPVWLSQRLGLRRDYAKVAASEIRERRTA